MPRVFTTPSGKNLSYVRKLGQGQFGVADLVRDRRHHDFCLKQVAVRTSDEAAKASVLKEVQLMKMSVHPNVVSLYDSWFERNRMFILMEFCINGSIDELIREYAASRRNFTEDKVVSFLTELSSALAHLHDALHIVHRDLKPANVFMDRIGTLKVGDFGLSKCLGGEPLCATYVGTPLYMSPEQCRGDAYSYASDVWSLGCIAFELMSLRSPWEGGPSTYPALVNRIQTRTPDFAALTERYSKNLVRCVQWMLRKIPDERWDAAMVSANMRPSMVNAPSSPPPTDATDSPWSSQGGGGAKGEAALVIQRSFRASRAGPSTPPLAAAVREAQKKEASADRTPKASEASPTGEEAVERIQTVFRASLTRRRRPVTPRTRASPTPHATQCSARINELAVPRVARRPAVLPRIPSSAVMQQRPPPRPAWT